MAGEVLIGTSGWVYPHWQGVFYPSRGSGVELLRFYAARFPTVEVNYSFYRLPLPSVFAAWRGATPEGFTFAVKASRYLTHVRKLQDAAEPLARLLASAGALGPKLGPILFQFPETWRCHLERLSSFLDILPESQRCAFEFRHASWLNEEVYSALSEHNCALCIPDSPSLPQERRLTADFTYVRLHGGALSPRYSDAELADWASWLGRVRAGGTDAYVYLNNDVSGFAVENAATLRGLLRNR